MATNTFRGADIVINGIEEARDQLTSISLDIHAHVKVGSVARFHYFLPI